MSGRVYMWLRGLVITFLLLAPLFGAGHAHAVDSDPDHDGLTTAQEKLTRTNPYRRDTDGDGVPDGREDPDHDGLVNWQEFRARTNPLDPDSNDNGIKDGQEDYDHDGVDNEDEDDGELKADASDRDYDQDGLDNEDEDEHGTSPRDADSDDDGIKDGDEDSDHDGVDDGDEDDQGEDSSQLEVVAVKTPSGIKYVAFPSPSSARRA